MCAYDCSVGIVIEIYIMKSNKNGKNRETGWERDVCIASDACTAERKST